MFGIIDTGRVETIHPWRDGRTEPPLGRKGISGHRWIAGAKVAVLVNPFGGVSAWMVRPDIHAPRRLLQHPVVRPEDSSPRRPRLTAFSAAIPAAGEEGVAPDAPAP